MKEKRICVVELYEEYFENKKYLLESLQVKGYELSTFSFFPTQKIKFSSKLKLLLDEFRCLIKLISNFLFFKQKKVLCLGGHFSFFLLNRLLGIFWGADFHLYIYNFYLHDMGKKKIVKYILRYLLNSAKITLIVQSPGEIEYYKNLSTKCEILFTPYCQDVNTDFVSIDLNGDYIFSGGYTNRDYQLMIECAKLFPELRFILIISSLNMNDFEKDIPNNITLYKDTSSALFYSIMRGASAVIIPLKSDVGASGQMLCLGALSLSKPAIYSETSSINYYFETDPKCGFPYKMGDIRSLSDAISKFTSCSKYEIDQIKENGYRNYWENYTSKKGWDRLIDILCE